MTLERCNRDELLFRDHAYTLSYEFISNDVARPHKKHKKHKKQLKRNAQNRANLSIGKMKTQKGMKASRLSNYEYISLVPAVTLRTDSA